MRFNLIVILIFSASFNANGQKQIMQGAYGVSGSLSYTTSIVEQKTNKWNTTEIYLGPKVSYFIYNSIELTTGIIFNYADHKFTSTVATSHFKEKRTQIDLGFRLYYPLGQSAPFVGADGWINWDGEFSQNYPPPVTSYSLLFGYDIFLNDVLALEPAIIYSRTRLSVDFNTYQYRFGFGVKYFVL